MFHLTTLSLAQSILIEFGILLQVTAIVAHIKRMSDYRRFMRTNCKGTDVEEEISDSQIFDLPVPTQTDLRLKRSRDERPRMKIEASHLLRTSKVKFVQSFKFREQGLNSAPYSQKPKMQQS
jgi:hypothetical protein